MKTTKKILAIILVILTLISIMSVATPVFAAEVTEMAETMNGTTETVSEEQNLNDAEKESEILYEDISRRDEYTKHFVMNNGLRRAVKYSQPIHYKENGKWIDIDNTLEYNQDSKKYENKSNSFKVNFDKDFNSEKFFTIENDGYTMSWRYNGNSVRNAFSTGKVEKHEDQTDGFRKYTQKTNGKIKYNKFESDCNLEYIVTGTGVKENIILESYMGKNKFSFEVTAKNLRFIKNEDKSISVVNQSGEEIFYIPAPFMYDSKNKFSYDVEYSIENKKGKYIISIIADENWLKDAERVYPITIDPIISTKKHRSAIDTTFIASDPVYAGSNLSAKTMVSIGWDTSTYGQTRTLVKFTLPELKDSDMVVKAQLSLALYHKSFYTTTMEDQQIDAHYITGKWNISSVTWNNKPGYNSIVQDYSFIRQTDVEGKSNWKYFDITKVTKRWYEGDLDNNGILIKKHKEGGTEGTDAACGYFWSEKYNDITNAYPTILIEYRNNKGLEDQWSYSSFGAGVGGIAYVNDYTGNLVFELPILSSISERKPITLVGYYNNYCANILIRETEAENVRTSIGRGFRLNYQQTVLPSTEYGLSGTDATKYPYVYTDGDGTEHYIQKSTEDGKTVYKDEDGLGFTLTTNCDIDATYQITDKSHNNYYFNNKGNLFKIKDNNGNEIKIIYKDASSSDDLLNKSRIDKIIDGAGHTYQFTYYVKSSTGVELDYVEKIVDDADREYKFKISDGLLLKITYPDGNVAKIDYNINSDDSSEGRINSVISNDNYELNFDYTSNSTGRRVKTVKEYGVTLNNGTYSYDLGQLVTFNRKTYNTTVIRNCGFDGIHNSKDSTKGADDIITTMQFDNAGRTISQQMKYGSGEEIGAGAYTYTTKDIDNSTSGFKNKVSGSGAIGKSVENLLYGGNAESSTNWSTGQSGEITVGTGTSSASQYIGQKSIKLTASEIGSEGARCYYRQNVTDFEKGCDYTLSAYVKTGDLSAYSNAALTGAFIQLIAYDSSGNAISSANARSQILTERSDLNINNGWRRLSATITAPQNAVSIRCYLFLRNTEGSVCFDGIQLEKGSTPNDYNMLENAGFEDATNNSPDSWGKEGSLSFSTGSTITDGVTTISDIRQKTTNVLKITGAASASKGVSQTVNIQKNPNDTYIVGGWAKGYPINSTFHTSGSGDDITYNAKFEIAVRVTYTKTDKDGNSSTVTQYKNSAKFNTTVTDWQYASTPIVLKYTNGEDGCTYTPTKILIMPRYNKQANYVHFDNIMLVKDVASSYTYDNEGNIISASSNSEQEANMKYDNNNLTSYTDTAGNETTAEYDSKNNMWRTKSAKGLYTRYNYNDYGNIEITELRDASTTATATAAIRTNNEYNAEATVDGVAINAGSYQTAYRDENNNATTYTRDHKTGVLTSETNAKQVTTNYEYYDNFSKSKAASVDGRRVFYSYNKDNRLENVIFGKQKGSDYTYPNDVETVVQSSDVTAEIYEKYSYVYDNFGNIKTISIGDKILATKTYNTNNGALMNIIYGNEDVERYTYNNLGQRTALYSIDKDSLSEAEKLLYSWEYNASSVSLSHTDHVNGYKYLFDYDSLGRLSKQETQNSTDSSYVGAIEYKYDVRNNLTKLLTNFGGKSRNQRYFYSPNDLSANSAEYAKDNLPTVYKLYESRYAVYDYDSLNRLVQRDFSTDKHLFYNYIYKKSDNRNSGSSEKFQTNQLKEEYIGNDVYIYSYDVLGNIIAIQSATRDIPNNGAPNITAHTTPTNYSSYEYDNLNQLTRENNATSNTSKVWTYDELGNIKNVTIHPYSNADLDDATKTVTYNYGAETFIEDNKTKTSWNHILKSVDLDGNGTTSDDEEIVYDKIGNPITYFGATLTWNGRQLISYTTDDKEITYTYDSNGLRVSKIQKDYMIGDDTKTLSKTTVTKYYYVNGQLYFQDALATNSDGTQDVTKLYFYYDSNGYLSGVEYNGTNYYVATNLRGDVVALYYHTGQIMARYEYDAWGNIIKIKDISYDDKGDQIITDLTNDTTSRDIAVVNPIRYRSYYYDAELQLYYLQSRYYNPNIGRFLNADTLLPNIGGDVIGYNIISYCSNNPVNFCDPTGRNEATYGNSSNTDNYVSIFEIIFVATGLLIYMSTPQGAVLTGQILDEIELPKIDFAKKSKTSGKERATDIPSWVNKGMIDKGKSAEENAWRILNEKWGKGNWNKGPKSDFNRIKKWLTRDLGLKSLAYDDSDIYIMDGHLIIYDNSGKGFGWFDGMYMEFFD